ncbi:MAG: D-amino peptidase [Kosmotogales bacterium]|nr:D-amino peptidase [Kosmotogales bacterium]
MKIFISSDIEGTAGINDWAETTLNKPEYKYYSEQMTEEVRAACDGAIKAGATEIIIKDAHDTARNINPSKLPMSAKIIRGWSGNPLIMMYGLDSSFDAAIYTGYHSFAGSDGNPLSHSMSTNIYSIEINDVLVSEFTINSFTAAYYRVPSVFISGDKSITNFARSFIEGIKTVATLEGKGGASTSINPNLACKLIEKGVFQSLKGDYKVLIPELPETFSVKVTYMRHKDAYRNSFFPGVSQTGSRAICFKETDFYEVLRKFLFIF